MKFIVGQRIKAHPATSMFQRGEVFGTVVSVEPRGREDIYGGELLVVAKMEKTGKLRGFLEPFVVAC